MARAGARGLVVCAHGRSCSRLSPRNRAVAMRLQEAGLATLLIDLLAPHEEGRRELVFDIPLLAARLEGVTRRARDDVAPRGLPVGFFGASTGPRAALRAAAALGPDVRPVASRRARPALAAARLPAVPRPTLLTFAPPHSATGVKAKSSIESKLVGTTSNVRRSGLKNAIDGPMPCPKFPTEWFPHMMSDVGVSYD